MAKEQEINTVCVDIIAAGIVENIINNIRRKCIYKFPVSIYGEEYSSHVSIESRSFSLIKHSDGGVIFDAVNERLKPLGLTINVTRSGGSGNSVKLTLETI